MTRSSGILLHLSSLPSATGIGTMGREARKFVDFLFLAGQKYWQILPVCPTSYGDSPYQSFSTFAGNPYFIDLDLLARDGLLKPEEYEDIDWGGTPDKVDYAVIYEKRYPVLHKACARLLASPPADYEAFCRDNAFWLPDYALFMALKTAHNGAAWHDWEPELVRRDPAALEEARRTYADEVNFWQAVQYLFFTQWSALKTYANEKGVQIIGDLPIYVAADSVDVWASPEEFQLDEDLLPTEVAGCPPDAFAATGQLWGNPLYDWDKMKQNGYAWWVRRIRHTCEIYDVVRIDHFRGFAGYYAIPYGDETAVGGRWRPGPGIDLFRTIERELGRREIIAEDLGFLTQEVYDLLAATGYPGMKVLEFAFDSRDGGGYLPHSYPRSCVAYTGTHDNEPAAGWLANTNEYTRARAIDYLRLSEEEGYHWGMLRGIWSSVADLAIVQAQDILGLGSEARMNTPSIPDGNWQWRARPGVFTRELAKKLRHLTEIYGRTNFWDVFPEEEPEEDKDTDAANPEATESETAETN